MKLQVVKENQEWIKNFEKVIVSPNQIDLSVASNNECEVILATDVLDSFSLNNIPELLRALLDKLRLGGEISIGGTDGRLLSKHTLNGLLSPDDTSSIVGELESVTFLPIVQQMLEGMGLKILSTNISGIHYEIKARRG